MAILSITKLNRNGASDGLNASSQGRTDYFHVVLDAADDSGAQSILASSTPAAIPRLGQKYAPTGVIYVGLNPSNLVCVSRRVDMDGVGGRNYTLAVDYAVAAVVGSASTVGTPSGAPPKPPWQNKPGISTGVKPYEYVMEKDVTAVTPQPVVNKAGVPFNPPLMTQKHNTTIHVHYARKDSSFNEAAARALIGSINTDAATIRGTLYAVKTLLLLDLSMELQVWPDTGLDYWNITATLEQENEVSVKERQILNKGFLQKVDGVLKFCTVKDPTTSEDIPTTEPVLLNTDGTQYTGSGDGSNFITFQIHSDKSWTDLKINDADAI